MKIMMTGLLLVTLAANEARAVAALSCEQEHSSKFPNSCQTYVKGNDSSLCNECVASACACISPPKGPISIYPPIPSPSDIHFAACVATNSLLRCAVPKMFTIF